MRDLWVRVEADVLKLDEADSATHRLSGFQTFGTYPKEHGNKTWRLGGVRPGEENFVTLAQGTRQHVHEQFQRIMNALAKTGQALDLNEPPSFEPLVPPVDLRTSAESFETRLLEFETSEGVVNPQDQLDAFAQFKTPSDAQTPPAKPES